MTKTTSPSSAPSPDEEPTVIGPLPFSHPREDDDADPMAPAPPGEIAGSADHAGMGRGDHPRHARSKSHDRN